MDSAKDVAVRESLRKIGNTEHGLQSVLTQDIRKQLTTITQHIDQLHARLISTLNTGDDSHAPGQGLDNMAARFKKVFELLAEYRDIYGKLDQRITDAEQSFRVLRFQFQRDIKSEWINVPVQQSHDTAMAIMPWDVAKRGKRRNAAMGAKKKKPRKKRAAKVLEGKIVTKENIAEARKARWEAKRAPRDPKAPRPTVKRLKMEPEDNAPAVVIIKKEGEKR